MSDVIFGAKSRANLVNERSPKRLEISCLIALGGALVLTNRWFGLVDDEYTIVDRAASPFRATINRFLGGIGQHEHPPLYDLFLHGWLALGGGSSLTWLRVPSVLFYLVGALVTIEIARRLGNRCSALAALLFLIFWPYGFHFGRVAAWYSLCFALLAFETFLYFAYLGEPSARNWTLLFICSLAMVYANYFSWLLLACLAFDFVVANRRTSRANLATVLGMVALLLILFSPILRAFMRELHVGVRTGIAPHTTILTSLYVTYSAFVSESVAPWFWWLGIPVALAIAVVVVCVVLCSPPVGRRFLAYFFLCLAMMSVIGVAGSKRTLILCVWMIFPVGLALGSDAKNHTRYLLLTSIAFIFAVGWFGIFYRKLYAAPHWTEPWDRIAASAASVVSSGGIVIGNSNSFFGYLTYAVSLDPRVQLHSFSGFLPDSVHARGVFSPDEWLATDQPTAPNTLLVKGLHYGSSEEATNETQRSLDLRCRTTADEFFTHDFGSDVKKRYVPKDNQLPWRVEVRHYACP